MRGLLAASPCALVLSLSAALGGNLVSESAHAFAANRDTHYSQPGAKRTWIVTSLGDSIAAGYCGVGCLGMDSYVHYFAYRNDGSIAKALNVNVESRGRAVSGFTSGEILDWMDHVPSSPIPGQDASGLDLPQDLREADVITIDACGNDYLPARRKFRETCEEGEVRKSIQTCRTHLDRIFRKAKSLAKENALIRVMNLYYPGVDRDREGRCGERSHFDAFLEFLVEGNYYTCEIARRHGIPCADAFSVMNAPDEDRERIAWIPGESLEEYKQRLTVTYKHLLSDPTQKRTPAGVVNLMQDDNVHPTAEGHARIGYAHQALGWGN